MRGLEIVTAGLETTKFNREMINRWFNQPLKEGRKNAYRMISGIDSSKTSLQQNGNNHENP